MFDCRPEQNGIIFALMLVVVWGNSFPSVIIWLEHCFYGVKRKTINRTSPECSFKESINYF